MESIVNYESIDDLPKVEEHVSSILQILGQDMTNLGREKTALRYAKFLDSFLYPRAVELTTFPAEGFDDMVIERNINFFSLCEHHLLPFFGTATIAYIPNKTVIGISKLARIVDVCSHKLQMQERLTNDIARVVEGALFPKGVAVILKARHLCQEMRGVRAVGAETVTSYYTGDFLENQGARAEFLQLIRT